MTQVQLAHRFGIDRSFLSQVETGQKSLSLPMLEVLALGFKISLADLVHNV